MTSELNEVRRVVAGIGASGDGRVETEDGPMFVPGALPGERVGWRDGRIDAIEPPFNPERRVETLCPHVGRCGGCSVQHMDDALYRRWKSALLPNALVRAGIGTDTVRPMLGVPRQSRRRAVLTVRRDGSRIEAGFLVQRAHLLEPLTACAVLTPRIVESLEALRELAGVLLATPSEARVTVLDSDVGLDIAFDAARENLSADARLALAGMAQKFRLARVSVGRNVLIMNAPPVISLGGVAVVPPPGAFVQAVAAAETEIVRLVSEAIGKAKRVADLFAGLGTLAFPLARRAQVLAIDSDRPLIDALDDAKRKTQGLKPIEARVRDLHRDPLSPRELDGLDAVVFDPPRAGAHEQAAALAKSNVPTVVAVSCNPQTLARDLHSLVAGGYRLEAVTPIDQFLFTPHLEAVAVLRRGKR